jgi:hypothetical protein
MKRTEDDVIIDLRRVRLMCRRIVPEPNALSAISRSFASSSAHYPLLLRDVRAWSLPENITNYDAQIFAGELPQVCKVFKQNQINKLYLRAFLFSS